MNQCKFCREPFNVEYEVICPTCGHDHDENYKMRSLLDKGDKIRRISDGKLFTYTGPDDSDDENYGHVEEMLVPVYLPDFEKEEE
ncbi:hypothetical protein P4639_14670 [Priestia megaterium]|uniref:hypothetical protein n=1 Tax=Priestia megaterium TaxID=1404 RepID=UPI002E23BE89|nr:hypothetical protein [Priestia megaterium]